MSGAPTSSPVPAATTARGEELQVTCWGSRGSMPVSGRRHLVFGGDTLCFEVRAGSRRLIIDAGSGLMALGRELARRKVVETDILLTHFHLDHLLGLMSFEPLFRRGTRVTIHAPVLEGRDPRRVLKRFLDAPYFPLGPEEAGAEFSVQTVRPGDSLRIERFSVETCLLAHPGGACGYRLEHDSRSVVIACDHEHGTLERDAALAALAQGADLVLYDAPWDERTDYAPHRGWGHSTWQAGLALMQKAGARRLACVHHAPTSDDRLLAGREAELRTLAPESLFLRQDQTLALP